MDDKVEIAILWPSDAKSWPIGKDTNAGRDWGQEEKGMIEDDMVGWHHWLNGHEFELAQGIVKDGEAWHASQWGPKSQTRLSDWTKEQPGKKLLMLLFNHQVVSDSVRHQTPLFMGFLRQEYWSGLPFSSPGDIPDPGIKPMSPLLAGGFFTTEPSGKPLARSRCAINILWVNEKWSAPEPDTSFCQEQSPEESSTSLFYESQRGCHFSGSFLRFHPVSFFLSDFLFFTTT